MSQLKFSFKIFEICSLLYFSVFTVNVALTVAIILFEYLLLDPSAGTGQMVQEERGPPAPYFLRL